jgi:hypothetical protein
VVVIDARHLGAGQAGDAAPGVAALVVAKHRRRPWWLGARRSGEASRRRCCCCRSATLVRISCPFFLRVEEAPA